MLGLKYEDIIERIKEEKNLTDEEIEVKVKQKLEQLSDLISKQGAAHIIANELGINLFDGSAGFKINRLAAGMRSVGVTAKVVKSYGVREFKSKFGGEEVRFGRYIKINRPVLYWIGKTGLKILQKIK